MKRTILALATAAILSIGVAQTVAAATLADATPGQTITRGQFVDPAIEAFLDARGIVTTNALEEPCAGQLITTGALDADYACWLAEGLRAAQR